MTKKEILLKQKNAENAPLTSYIGVDGYVWKMIENAMEEYHQAKLKLLGIANVSGSLLSDLDYWKLRCELAEKCIEESPCDPDITSDQIKAHNDYNKFISNFGNDR